MNLIEELHATLGKKGCAALVALVLPKVASNEEMVECLEIIKKAPNADAAIEQLEKHLNNWGEKFARVGLGLESGKAMIALVIHDFGMWYYERQDPTPDHPDN